MEPVGQAASPKPDHDAELFFELGGPAYRLMRRIGIIRGSGPCVGRRSVVFILVMWVPMALLAVADGQAIGPTPRTSLLLDFATYARFFLAVPLIFAAEAVVGPRIREAGLRFLRAGIVRPASYWQFSAAVARVQRRRESLVAEIAFAVIAIGSAWSISLEQVAGLGAANWHTVSMVGGPHLTLSGSWYHFVALPILQFFVLRWLWRVVIWTLFLAAVARMQLNLMPTHTDMAGGLGFLGTAHVAMAILPFAASCVLSAEIAFQMQFEGLDLARLQAMAPLLIAYLVLVAVMTVGPLLVFVPAMARARLAALATYGILVQRHNQQFHDKWIAGPDAAAASPLGDGDMSSLVDLGSSYTVVRQMSVFPFGRNQLLQVMIVSCLPGLPLIFLVLPFAAVIRLLSGVIL